MPFKKRHIPWNKNKKLGPYSEERKRNISQSLTGRKLSESHKNKVIKNLKPGFKKGNIGWNKGKKGSHSGEKNPFYGKEHTNESKKKISISMKQQYKNGTRKVHKHSGRGIAGIRDDLNQFFRCTWEANIARILKFNEFKYEYEPKKFDLGELGTYRPDFYLPEKDLYIEVKGYNWNNSLEKALKFKETNNLLLIEEKDYKQLAYSYSQFIPNWEIK